MKKLNLLSLALSAGVLLFCGACSTGTQEQEKAQRPREAWVMRSVLDQKPRMISVALNENLWLAYNTQTASLYKAWTGGVNFDGPVYTAAHGPQPTSQGTTYMQEPDENLWVIQENGAEVSPEVNYKGHQIQENNQLLLKYELVHNGQKIMVEEKPEFFAVEGDKVGLERAFTVSGLPEGMQLGLKMQLSSLLSENDYKTNGNFAVQSKEQEEIEGNKYSVLNGRLMLNNNGQTNISMKLSPKPMPKLAASVKTAEGEEKILALMAKSDCNTCHNEEVKTVGPAYVDIAKRYSNTAEKSEELVAKIIKGGAGNWGDVPMTPHPDLTEEDALLMVSYIQELDAEQEAKQANSELMPETDFEIQFQPVDRNKMGQKEEKAGIAVNVYQFSESVLNIPEINDEMLPVASGSLNALHAGEDGFGGLEKNFVIHATGFIHVKENTNVVFRLVSDDGSMLYIDDKLIVDNGGNHAMEAKEGETILKEGKNPFKVEYYQGGGGKGLSLQWRPYGSEAFSVVPPEVFTFTGADIKKTQNAPLAAGDKEAVPGDGFPLEGVHPAFDLAQARPASFQPKVGGMDFLSDGRMVISTWDSLGSVYLLDGVQTGDPEKIEVKRIAFGLAEPLGLKVVDDEIYVLQKQELTRLIDLDGDDIIDEYQTMTNGWKVSANFHEFAFGLVYKDGYFYGALATAINPGGASTQPQIPDRGKVLKISKEDGSYELIAQGLRTPNGIGFGVDNEIFIADNQGDWLPASKIVHLQPGAWYGSRSVDFEGTANLEETLPVVWLPQDEIGNSPSQPAVLNVGPYQNQMIHGEVTHGGIKRVFAEKVKGAYQGVVFRFSQGLEAGINRLVWGPDGSLYAGGVGSTGNWNHSGGLHYGLQRLTYNQKPVFEMLAVRAKHNGVEIEFTEPLKEGSGTKASDYQVRQWWYKPTAEYGGPKLDDKALDIRSVVVSDDRRKVFLELSGMKARHMVYIRLNKDKISSESDRGLWTTEAWYNMNNIPDKPALAKK